MENQTEKRWERLSVEHVTVSYCEAQIHPSTCRLETANIPPIQPPATP